MTDQKPRVYVAQDNGFNYTHCEEFGEVVILSTKDLVPWAGSTTNTAIIHGIEAPILAEYRPGVDYICPSGSPLACAHMFRAAFTRTGVHQLLKWDRRANKYYIYEMDNRKYDPIGDRDVNERT